MPVLSAVHILIDSSQRKNIVISLIAAPLHVFYFPAYEVIKASIGARANRKKS